MIVTLPQAVNVTRVRRRQHRGVRLPTTDSATRGITIETSPTDGGGLHDARRATILPFNDDAHGHRRYADRGRR